MSAKQNTMSIEERRIARREVPPQKPKGTFQLYVGVRNLNVDQIRDISLFGIGLELDVNVDPGTEVKLKYAFKGIQITLLGTIAWRKTLKQSTTSQPYMTGCCVGISFHPEDLDANFALYHMITGKQ